MKRIVQALRARLWAERRQRIAFVLALLLALGIGYGTVLGPALDSLEADRAGEPRLKQEYKDKLAQAVNLRAVREQKLQMLAAVGRTEAALPARASLVQLASLAHEHGLRVDLLEADEAETIGDYYALRSARLKLNGNFGQFASFTEALAELRREMALRQMVWKAVPATKSIALEAVVDIRRWLTVEEVAAAMKARRPKGRRE